MINRILHTEIRRLLQYFSVIVLTGPRQSGKTTLCKEMLKDYAYFNLEDLLVLQQIQEAPKQFLEKYAPNGIILDEAQRYPDVFSFVQVVADEHPDYRFVLTGSSNFALMHKVTQSLAGRAALFTLLPLSLAELAENIDKETDTLMFNGGLPAVWAKQIPATDVCRSYYNTYIERDVRELLNIKELSKFQTFIRLCAGRVGSEFNASSLANEIGVSVFTINEWLSVLEASYILFRLPPFFRNIGKRLIKTPKIYFYDTALVCFLLNIENETQLASHPLRGSIFENLVVLEFIKNRLNVGKEPNIYFYRDKSQHEVDVIQEFGDSYRAYEIKSARAFHSDFPKNLKYLKSILGDTLTLTQVIYDGDTDTDISENGVVNFRRISL
ncbi:MAG: ATP-binding protein [Prevotellaceae bacterium]|nr:ATP-binding protein [Prevotellaceae bacterium]